MFKVETFRELLNGGVRFHVVFGERLACRGLIDDLIGSAGHFRGRPKITRNIIKIIAPVITRKKTVCPVNLQGGEKRFSPSKLSRYILETVQVSMYVDLCTTSDVTSCNIMSHIRLKSPYRQNFYFLT